MKLVVNQKYQKKATLIWTVLIIILGAVSGFAVWLSTDREELINEPVSSPQKSLTTDRREDSSTEKTILLPGAAPIKPISGNYSADDHIWRLVNKSHPLSDTAYRPADLALAEVPSRTDKPTDERSIRQIIQEPTSRMFRDAKEQGIDLIIGSGFRSAELQQVYYSNYVKNYGQAAADSFSAKPGYSEHQTGLVMDLATVDRNCYLDECFGETAAGKWLRDNASNYGFILRYPEGKDGITDFIYEPWHFRYVGVELAKALEQSGLTLDEAQVYLTQN